MQFLQVSGDKDITLVHGIPELEAVGVWEIMQEKHHLLSCHVLLLFHGYLVFATVKNKKIALHGLLI